MTLGHNAQSQILAIVERLERLEEEKKGIGEDIKDVFKEAKGNGLDTKGIKHVLKLRKMTPQKRHEEAEINAIYEHAVGLAAEEN